MRKQVTSWLSNTPSIAGGPPAGVIAALMAVSYAVYCRRDAAAA